uniref:MULE transposase domain-containing protein n=1 Tax=Lactuca sativa TaxID=4236 RepID=A0A9R1X510_LACSA|nr:hypothetical protein LSAT_V11C600322230 [Lactuca sativa]
MQVRVIAKCGSGTCDNEEIRCPFRVADEWKNYHLGSLDTSNWITKHYLKANRLVPKWLARPIFTTLSERYNHEVQDDISRDASRCATKFFSECIRWAMLKERASTIGMIEGKLYVGFKAFRDGWYRGCRRVIGLDGSFLKGKIKGEILTAIGRDAENHVYPIAWAVVNFIENLVADLDLGAGNKFIFISDQHKGIVQAVADLLPYVVHDTVLDKYLVHIIGAEEFVSGSFYEYIGRRLCCYNGEDNEDNRIMIQSSYGKKT